MAQGPQMQHGMQPKSVEVRDATLGANEKVEKRSNFAGSGSDHRTCPFED